MKSSVQAAVETLIPAAPAPLKPFLPFEAQLDLLKQRGMVVESDERALRALKRVGYYRLAGYWYPLREPNPPNTAGRLDTYRAGASFDLVYNLYEFDKRLRMIVLDAIERIEIALRVDVSHTLGKRSPSAHHDPACLDGRFCTQQTKAGATAFDEWHQRLEEAVRQSKDDFVAHHVEKYGGQMPVWVSVELWGFGQLSRMYAGLMFKDQTTIANTYGLDGPTLESWLRFLTVVRNISAHHSRLWNRVLLPPRLPRKGTRPILDHLYKEGVLTRVYAALAILRFLLRIIEPSSTWHSQVQSLFANFPAHPLVSVKSAGMPDDWEKLPLWA